MEDTQGAKRFILAPPGTGKTYAAQQRPDEIADIDFGILRLIKVQDENGNPTKALNPEYPQNVFKAIADAYQTKNTVVMPSSWGMANSMVDILSKEHLDMSTLKEFASRFINDVHRDEITEEEKVVKTQELVDKLVPEFRRLKK